MLYYTISKCLPYMLSLSGHQIGCNFPYVEVKQTQIWYVHYMVVIINKDLVKFKWYFYSDIALKNSI